MSSQSKINVQKDLNSRVKTPGLAFNFNLNTSSDDQCPTLLPASQKNTSPDHSANIRYSPTYQFSSESSSNAFHLAVSNSVNSNHLSSNNAVLSPTAIGRMYYFFLFDSIMWSPEHFNAWVSNTFSIFEDNMKMFYKLLHIIQKDVSTSRKVYNVAKGLTKKNKIQ
ncbi:3721_t:CDS:1, partial [Gigaspora rosea]